MLQVFLSTCFLKFEKTIKFQLVSGSKAKIAHCGYHTHETIRDSPPYYSIGTELAKKDLEEVERRRIDQRRKRWEKMRGLGGAHSANFGATRGCR